MPIRAIFFDAGYTLIQPHPSFEEIFCDICNNAGCSLNPESVALVESSAWKLATSPPTPFTLSQAGARLFWLKYFRHLLEKLGEKPRPDLLEKLVIIFARPEKYALYPDVLPALKEIKSRGFILGMISNWEGWLLTRLQELKAAEYFDHIVISAHLGIEKPAPDIFLEALRLAQVQPSEALHVGDSLENDFLPAQRLGMQAVLINRRGHPAGAGNHTIRSLDELLKLLP